MLPDRVSNPGPLTYESGALPIALRGPACSSNQNFWLAERKRNYLLIALFNKFILDTFQDRRINCYHIDVTRCPLEHFKHLVISCAAITVFVAMHVCWGNTVSKTQ